MTERPTVAIAGGTGALGGGLAWRLARAGYEVIIGSRSAERAVEAAAELAGETGNDRVTGEENGAAAARADMVIVAVPFAAHDRTLDDIADHVAGKIVVDTTVPLVPPKVSTVQLPEGNAAALRTAARLGDDATVVAAFQNVAAHKLKSDGGIGCDVLVCSNDKDAREAVVRLAGDIGLRGVHAGPLANAVAVESLTSVLIGINRRYKVDGAGIRITGLEGDSAAT